MRAGCRRKWRLVSSSTTHTTRVSNQGAWCWLCVLSRARVAQRRLRCHAVEVPARCVVWASYGHHTDIIRTSYGHHTDIIRTRNRT